MVKFSLAGRVATLGTVPFVEALVGLVAEPDELVVFVEFEVSTVVSLKSQVSISGSSVYISKVMWSGVEFANLIKIPSSYDPLAFAAFSIYK